MVFVSKCLIRTGVIAALLLTSSLPAQPAPGAHPAVAVATARKPAAEGRQPTSPPSPRSLLAVSQPLGVPPNGVADLKFRDLFKLPVGPKGLEPTPKLRRLDGKRVRIVGYMVQQQSAVAGGFLLSPLPVAAGDEDESLADDIPASAIFVGLPQGASAIVPPLPGLLGISGTLRVGAREIPGADRVAAVRIELDAEAERALLDLARTPVVGATQAR